MAASHALLYEPFLGCALSFALFRLHRHSLHHFAKIFEYPIRVIGQNIDILFSFGRLKRKVSLIGDLIEAG